MPRPPVQELTTSVPAEQAEHLVLAFAACDAELWWPTVERLPASSVPHLRALLAGMRPVARRTGDPRSLTPPHEVALAQDAGLSAADGLTPWAACTQALANGAVPMQPCGFLTLCHWAMGREHATLSDPDALDLSEAESRALLESMRPFFESDGLQLHYLHPLRWLVQGQAMNAATASLDRVLGRNVDPWLPPAQDARLLRRLQNEMQMLLYTHPVNEARQQRRQLTANSVWFSGTGKLEHLPTKHNTHLSRTLASPALADDWPAYAQAWQTVDATELRALLHKQQAGQTVRLSLCGERGCLTLETAPRTLGARLQQWMRKPAWPGVLQQAAL